MQVFYPVQFKETESSVVQMSNVMRQLFRYSLKETADLRFVKIENSPIVIESISIELINSYPTNQNIKISQEQLIEQFKRTFADYPFCPGQQLLMKLDVEHNEPYFVIEIKNINNQQQAEDKAPVFQIRETSEITLTLSETCSKRCTVSQTALPKQFTLDFSVKGVGGHKEELAKLIRDAFYTRAMGEKYTQAYDIKHTKGVLLYGPPGTGKTLIARTIGGFFSKEKIKVVNGPELKSPYVGKSQENLRAIFSDAQLEWDQRGEASDLHVIIIDEIDALCPPSGTRSGSTGVDDDMVTQLLTILDGVKSLQNIVSFKELRTFCFT